MHNPLKRFVEFIKTPGHSRTISTLVILIIAAAVPLTVLVAQQQQETRQRASLEPICTNNCTTLNATRCPSQGSSTIQYCSRNSQGCLVWTTGNCGTSTNPYVCVTNSSGTAQCLAKACTANSKECVSTTDFKTCNSTGTGWGLKITCPAGQTCSGGNCVTTAKCTSGATKCVSSTVSATCNSSGVWISSGCASGSTCSTSTGKCSATTDPCTHTINGLYVKGGYCPSPYGGKYLYNCLNGKTVSTTTCTYGCQHNNNAVDTCKSAPAPTPTPSGACSLGAYQCSGQILQKCDVNAATGFKVWTTVKTCSTSYPCDAKLHDCASCSLGAYQCSGQTLQQCIVNASTGFKVWSTLKTCSSPQVCSVSAKTCVTPVTPTPAPTVCKAGTGSTIASCGGHDRYSCTSTTNCEEYTFRCSGSSCVSGAHQSVAKTYCAKGSICNPNTVTPSPTPVPIPNCNASPQLSACIATTSNTCSANNGTQTVRYTTYNGSTRCTPVSKTQTCTVSNCNIGNVCTNGTCVAKATPTPVPSIGPTPTPIPGHTELAFSIGMDAIGSTGDNVNPNPSSSNKTPINTRRNLDAQVFDSNNNQVIAQVGSINYNANVGYYEGTVDLGTNFANGNYTVKIKSEGHLKRLIPGIQNISSALHQPIQLPKVNLVAGDVDNNNILNINDYNILLSCVTSPYIANIDDHALCNTNANYIKLSDLEDNGVINEFDYNLFLREYSVQNGD